jgi:predicted TIM-barrel enzyme
MKKMFKRFIAISTLVVLLGLTTSTAIAATTCPPHQSTIKYTQKVGEEVQNMSHDYLYDITTGEMRTCNYQMVTDVYVAYYYCSKCGIYMYSNTIRPYSAYPRGHVCGL